MKLTQRQLVRLIREIIYVNPEGDAVAPDDVGPYSFMAGHSDPKIAKLGAHKDKKYRKMAATLAAPVDGDNVTYRAMAAKEKDIRQLDKNLEIDHQLNQLSLSPYSITSFKRDDDTTMKNLDADPRQVKMAVKMVDQYVSKIESITGDYVFSANRHYDYLDGLGSLHGLLDDAYDVVLKDIPSLGNIVKIYERKEEYEILDALVEKIKSVIHDYLIYDRGLYDLFYKEDGRGRDR